MLLRLLLDHWTTLYPRPVKAMGYIREVQGIQRRYRRVARHWQSHIGQTRSTILAGVECCKQYRTAVVLGGGLLHDVPFAELCQRFQKVLLVDLIHPWQSRWMTRHYPNLQRIAADVTETIDQVYRIADDPQQLLPEKVPSFLLDHPEIDYVASVNLLSQLPCMPMTYLESRGGHGPETIREYARGLIRSHLSYLRAFSGVASLITDYERIKLTLMNQIVETRDLFFGIARPAADRHWEWQLAPCPEADPRHHYYRRVLGIPNLV